MGPLGAILMREMGKRILEAAVVAGLAATAMGLGQWAVEGIKKVYAENKPPQPAPVPTPAVVPDAPVKKTPRRKTKK